MRYEELERQALSLNRQQRSRLMQTLLESLNEICFDLPVTPLPLETPAPVAPPTQALDDTSPAITIDSVNQAFQQLREALSKKTGEV